MKYHEHRYSNRWWSYYPTIYTTCMEMVMSTAAKMLRNGKSALFATRESTTEALEYVFQILGKSPETATAVMVYHNTLLEEAARVIEEYENATNESNNKGRTRH